MTHVFTLKATGRDGLTGECEHIVESTTCFATEEIAESRIKKFGSMLIERSMMDGNQPIKIEIIPHEVIYQ